MKTKLLLFSFILIQLVVGMLTTKKVEVNNSRCLDTVPNVLNDSAVFDEEILGEPIDLGLSVKWASHNVGATCPEDYGGYYAWGEIEEKNYYDWRTYLHCDGYGKTCHDLGKEISGSQYDVAHVKWGGKWRLPTKDEAKELFTKCNYVWTKVNGVQGVKFIAKNGNSIFFPNSGYRKERDLYDRGLYGCYWTGTRGVKNKAGNAFNMAFIERYKGWNENYRCGGRSIRPVMSE